MILDKMDPPPRYTPKPLAGIVYRTFPSPDPNLAKQEQQRKTLYWISTSLRLVNRAFYIASMHVLRSTYLPHFLSLVRPPYTSDPFPRSLPNAAADPLHSIQRESIVLDLFIVIKVREDVWSDDSELHLEREEAYRDLFDLHQPRSRLEDLVRIYGTENSVITLQKSCSIYSTPSSSTPSLSALSKASPSTQSPLRTMFFGRSSKSSSPVATTSSRPTIQSITPIPFSTLSVQFTPRKVSLVLADNQRKRSIVEVQRGRQDSLETTARQLVSQLAHRLREGRGI
ncbi:hypothetical protein F5887DRAFT_981728 [Amanita rubescens]|nr:hypothetical protein F5887DRAFT_981728 [Amanita rubescens]